MTCSFEEISFRALFDAAADAMLIVDSKGLVVLANPAVQQLLGYSREELNGNPVEAIMPQQYREIHRQQRTRFLQEPTKRPMGNGLELYALSRDGSELPVDISLSPISAGNGESFTLATIYSIAARKQAKHELHISEERLRLAAEAALFGTFDADLAAGTLYWSPELRTIIGLSAGTQSPSLGEEFNYLHPDDAERVRALLSSAYGPGGSGEVEDELRIVRPDGGVRWLLVKGRARFAGAGAARRAVRATGIALDITGRKNAENALKASEVLFKTIVDSSPIPIVISRLSDGIIIEANAAFLNLYGYLREEVIGHSSLDLHLWSDPEQRKKMYELIKSSGQAGMAFSFTRKTGKAGFGIFSAATIMLFGEPHVIGFLLDMTERRKMEREILERRDEMDELQKLHVAAQTAAAIAHELNQPLLAIASYCEAVLMLLQAQKPDLVKIRNAVEASERQAHRAGQEIRELLEFLSMKDFPTEAFDLNQEIIDVLDAARSEHDLQFQTIRQLEQGLPPVQANRTHVQKVLLNLLRNGIEAMREAGVPLPAITVTVRTAKDKSVAQVTIRDNGPGFEEEDVQRLFQPFFTTKTKGIGMGLAISRSLVEANGGQLWVDPQESPGATFHLTLPFAP